jgi:hypothetical protein
VGGLDGGEKGPIATRFCSSCGTRLGEPIGRFCQSCGAEVGSKADFTQAVEPVPQTAHSPQRSAADPAQGQGGSDSSPSKPPSSPGAPARKLSRSWAFALLALAVLVAAGVVLLAGGSGGSKKSSREGGITTLPSPSDLPPRTVALVSHVPAALATITRVELKRAITDGAAQSGLHSPPPPGSPKYGETEEAALRELLETTWIQGEAEEMGISVPPKRIQTEFAQIKKQNFKTEKAYREFLRTSHLSQQDILDRVRVQILSEGVQSRLARRVARPTSDEVAHYYAANKNTQFTNPANGSTPARIQPLGAVDAQIRSQLKQQAEQEYLSNFIKLYKARWRSRTVCLPNYAVEDCSNGPAPAQATRSEGGETAIPVGP